MCLTVSNPENSFLVTRWRLIYHMQKVQENLVYNNRSISPKVGLDFAKWPRKSMKNFYPEHNYDLPILACSNFDTENIKGIFYSWIMF